MEGKMRRVVSVIMTVILIMSSIILSTGMGYAGEENSEALKMAITTVKKVVDIPTTMDKFNYYYVEDEIDSEINLNWSDDENNEYISARVDSNGLIKSFNSYFRSFEANGLAKISKKQAEKVADSYLKAFLPKSIGTFKIQNDYENSYGSDYVFNYRMYVNDIPCDFVNINITINKYSGKLSNYNCNAQYKELVDNSYPKESTLIGEDKAREIYIENFGPELKFTSFYDYDKEDLKIFAAYLSNYKNKAINATTGEITELFNDIILYKEKGPVAGYGENVKVAADESEVVFSDAEIKEMQATKNLISKSEADKIARNQISNISKMKLNGSSLNVERGPSQNYIWFLNYEDAYVRVNAKDGSLVGFNVYTERKENDKRDIGLEKAKTIAESFIAKVCSDKKELLDVADIDDNKYMNSYNFTYERKTDYINFRDNGVNFSIDKATGNVINYSQTWYDKAKFVKKGEFISGEKAFDEMDKLGRFELIYKKDKDGKVVLVYDFSKKDNYILDAYSGSRLDYRGTIYQTKADYTDIKGHWAENTILSLKENGYYLQGDKFLPKSATTQLEFFQYLYSQEREYYTDMDQFYKMLIDNKIILKSEVNPEANLTRQDAAKFVARYMGIDKLAREASIFKNVYTDKVQAEYVGYATAAYAMGIMTGDSKGRFNGTKTLNHAETACVIFNLLNKN